MRNRPDDLIAAIVASILLIITIEYLPDSPVRQIVGLFFLLVLPGYVFVAAIFPRKIDIDIVERIALSLGLSIAIFPLIALGEYFVFSAITLEEIEFALAGFVIIVTFIAWQRRIKLPEDERFAVDIDINLTTRGMPFIDRLLLIGIIIAASACLIMLSMISTTPTGWETYSEIGILGPAGEIGHYPMNLSTNQVATVRVTVGSHEGIERAYSLVILLQHENATGANITHWRNGDPFNGIQAMDNGLAMAYNFTLMPSEYMNSTYDFSVSQNGTYKLRFMLFYDGDDIFGQPSREGWIWVNIAD